MNAERFSSKEYSEDSLEVIDFIRVCQLTVGQKFLLNGSWKVVTSISKTSVFYRHPDTRVCHKKDSVGAKSQQFVQIVKLKS